MTSSPLPTVPVDGLAPGGLLLDVREPEEWAAGHAPDAVHVPMHAVPDRLEDLPRDRPVDVLCRVGARSAQVVAYLVAHGVDARNVDGGMQAWASAGLPVVVDGGGPGAVV